MDFIDAVVVIKTPFHFLLFERVVLKNNPDIKTLVLSNYDVHIKEETKKFYPNLFFETIPKGDLFVKKLFKNPYKELKKIREIMFNYSIFLKRIFKDYALPKKVYIFSDKDVFTQFYIFNLNKQYPSKIVAIEEGTSFYMEETLIDFIFKISYNIFSKLILGFNYVYVGTYGSSNLVDTVYLRFPEYLPKKNHYNKRRKIIKIDLYHEKIKVNNLSTNILLLSSPLKEYMVLANGLEKRLFFDLVNYSQKNNYKLYLKPHPKENLSKYGSLINKEIEVIDKNIPFEAIELYDYKVIINYASSAILDAYERNYPIENIITISPYKKPLSLNKLYENSKYLSIYKKSKLRRHEEIYDFLIGNLNKILS